MPGVLDKEDLLRKAAERGDAKEASILIQENADVNHRDENGKNPLHYALMNRHLEIFEMLVAAGADVKSTYKFDYTLMNIAAYMGEAKVVSDLIKAGVSVSSPRLKRGYTPLHSAVIGSPREDVILMLIEAGAAVDAVDSDGYTPLHLAISSKQPETASVLIKAGADMYAPSIRGRTPLDFLNAVACLDAVKEITSCIGAYLP